MGPGAPAGPVGSGVLAGPAVPSGGASESGIGQLFGRSGSGSSSSGSSSSGSTATSGGFPGGSASGAEGAIPGGAEGGFPGGGRSTAGGPGGGQSTASITTWVKVHYKAVTIGGQTVYDLTQPKS